MNKAKFIVLNFLLISSSLWAHTFKFVDNKDKANDSLSKQFIQNIAQAFKVEVFFETGTWDAGTTQNAAAFFKEVHTVELYEPLYRAAKSTLAPYTHVHLHYGSSPEVFKKVLPTIEGKILFYLDAHYSGQGTALSFDDHEDGNAITAIRQELEAIERIGLSDCVILIDDIRGFGIRIDDQEFMGCWAYPAVQDLHQQLLKINSHFTIALLGDTLLAYDQTKYKVDLSPVVKACTQTRFFDGSNLTEKELLEAEKDIMNAPQEEQAFIEHLYTIMTNHKDPMFWHDLWYGLVSLGNKSYSKAIEGFSKVSNRVEHFNKTRQVVDRTLSYDHWRIDWYLLQAHQK